MSSSSIKDETIKEEKPKNEPKSEANEEDVEETPELEDITNENLRHPIKIEEVETDDVVFVEEKAKRGGMTYMSIDTYVSCKSCEN